MEKAARATRPAEQQQQRSPPAAAARAGSSKPGHADDSHILRKEDLKEAVLLVQNKLAAQLELAAPGRRPAAFCSAASSTLAEPAATTTGQTAAAQVGQAPAAEPCAALLHPRCASNLCALSAQGALASSCTATNRISSLCLAGTSPLGGAERSHFAARRSLHHRGKRGQGRLHSREATDRSRAPGRARLHPSMLTASPRARPSVFESRRPPWLSLLRGVACRGSDPSRNPST